ncbi:MAG: ATP-binding protein [Deltaproteobacteria bacterium]|jgi:anti-sigma regulatory factor (Ser/Thr protein kinase)|nr:ATP-binding protein [Deltaproteobacteria bacterium]
MVTLRLPARMESFGAFRSFVVEQMERESDLEELIPRVDLVLEEVLINAINYAYPNGEGDIEVECEVAGPKKFRVTVKDWGAPFNPLEQEDPDLTADIDSREVGGVGIFLVKQMTSRLDYEYTNGGNVLTAWFED